MVIHHEDACPVKVNRPMADQDGEYLHGAHVIITKALSQIMGGDENDHLDEASYVLEKLADEGWHLFTYEDAGEMLGAYLMSKAR